MNQDFLDPLRETGVRFLVVGAHAMAVHDAPRATGDLDLWVEPAKDNARRAWQALLAFGAPLQALHLQPEDFAERGNAIQFGHPVASIRSRPSTG